MWSIKCVIFFFFCFLFDKNLLQTSLNLCGFTESKHNRLHDLDVRFPGHNWTLLKSHYLSA